MIERFILYAGIIFIDGDVWKEMRRFTIRTLRDFGFGKQKSMESTLVEEVTELTERLDKKLEGRENEPVCMRQFFTISILNILWSMIAGFRFDHDDEKLKELLYLSDCTSKVNPVGSNLVQAFPFLRHFAALTPSGKTRHKFIREMHNFFYVSFGDAQTFTVELRNKL